MAEISQGERLVRVSTFKSMEIRKEYSGKAFSCVWLEDKCLKIIVDVAGQVNWDLTIASCKHV